MSQLLSILLGCFLVIAGIILHLYRQHSTSRSKLPFPPGPRPLPLLGNVLDLPTLHEYETYRRWGKEFGDVVHVSALGQHIIVLNSVEAASELLEQRSAIYSARPYVPMMHERNLMNADWTFALKSCTPSWKRQRRLFTRFVNPTTALVFLQHQVTATHTLLRSLLHDPTELKAHLKHAAASIILGVAYGYEVQPVNDPLVELVDRMLSQISRGVSPGSYLVNVFPWLNYIPSWFPGTNFKAFAAQTRKLAQDLIRIPFEDLQARIELGTAPPSFISNALAELTDDSPMHLLQDIKEVAATMYTAASDTTVSVLQSCILSLILNPDIQARAHAELDVVLGSPASPTFRLPTYDDRPHLPYIEAIMKEGMRWLPPLATGIPHATTEEDEYRGWRIPKGSIVIANSWGILRDEKIYPDPFVFRPERFLASEGKLQELDPGISGRLGLAGACPGRDLAESSVWMEIASMLAVFTFKPAKDKEGREIDVHYATNPESAFILHPQRFPCSIQVRSKETEARIRETGSNVEGIS